MDKTLSNELAKRENVEFCTLINSFLPDPDPILMRNGHNPGILKKLMHDPHLTSCVSSRKSGVLCKEWNIEGENTQQLKFIQDIFNKIDIDTLISAILNAPLFGFQPIEVVWNVENNHIIPAKVEAKPFEWFVFDSQNRLRLLTISSAIDGELVPDKKFLLPQNNPTYDNPYGQKLLSSVFWSVTFKKGGMKFWATFTEKYGMPFAVGKLPKSQLDAEGQGLVNALENMVQDGVAVIDDVGSIELIEASGKAASADVYEKLVSFSNQEISKAILGQTLTTEIGNTGSYAAGKVHFDVRQDIIESDKRLVQKTINQLIRWICELNFSDLSNCPTFHLYEEQEVDKERADRDQVLANLGVKFKKEYFQDSFGLNPEHFDIAETSKGGNFSEEENSSKKKDIFDELESLYSDEELQRQAEELLTPVLKIINESNDYNEALEKLAESYPEMSSDRLIDKLTQVSFIANVQGQIDGSIS